MDENTFNQLDIAYNSSPSLELGLVILKQLINHEDDEKLKLFLDKLRSNLDQDDLLKVAGDLYENNHYEIVLNLLSKEDINHFELIINCMIKKKMITEVKQFINKAQELDVTKSYSESFKEIKELEKDLNSKTKLKVVERIDFSEITDIGKYKQEVTNFSDVIGLEDIKKQVNKKIILPFQKPSLFQRFKKKIGGGVLLYGPPGCGKTLLARATAGECKANFFNVEISDILDMYIGESEQKLHAIFEKARTEKPSVLFFDEFEAMAGKRDGSRNESYSNVVSQFLTELDGFNQKNSGILVLASTNVPWSIDSAFLRPGRFDRMFFVPPPDKLAREGILDHHMKGRPAEKNLNFSVLASKCKGYSGADLFNLIEMAADEAIDESIETGSDVLINSSHFKEALEYSNSTTIEWLTTARNYARYANDGGRYNDVLKFIQKHGR